MALNIKQKANEFLQKFDLLTVDISSLEDIIKNQGYTVIDFNSTYNDGAVGELLSALGLEKYTASDGFTYADKKYRLVFINESLSESERLIVLAHEEGHIYLDHLTNEKIVGKSVTEEHEANEFSHFILKPHKIEAFLTRHRSAVFALTLVAIFLTSGIVLYSLLKEDNKPDKNAQIIYLSSTTSSKKTNAGDYYGEYYLTLTGTKYHTKDCQFVEGKDTTRRMTVSDYESGDYKPCKICCPDEQYFDPS